MCQKLIVVLIPPHTQLALTRSLHATLLASATPCSRNGRCSTSVDPATRAATGRCPMSNTGHGPIQSTSAKGLCLYTTSTLVTVKQNGCTDKIPDAMIQYFWQQYSAEVLQGYLKLGFIIVHNRVGNLY